MGPAHSTVVNHTDKRICVLTFDHSDILYIIYHNLYVIQPGESVVVEASPDPIGLKVGLVYDVSEDSHELLYQRFDCKNESVLNISEIDYAEISWYGDNVSGYNTGTIKEKNKIPITMVRESLDNVPPTMTALGGKYENEPIRRHISGSVANAQNGPQQTILGVHTSSGGYGGGSSSGGGMAKGSLLMARRQAQEHDREGDIRGSDGGANNEGVLYVTAKEKWQAEFGRMRAAADEAAKKLADSKEAQRVAARRAKEAATEATSKGRMRPQTHSGTDYHNSRFGDAGGTHMDKGDPHGGEYYDDENEEGDDVDVDDDVAALKAEAEAREKFEAELRRLRVEGGGLASDPKSKNSNAGVRTSQRNSNRIDGDEEDDASFSLPRPPSSKQNRERERGRPVGGDESSVNRTVDSQLNRGSAALAIGDEEDEELLDERAYRKKNTSSSSAVQGSRGKGAPAQLPNKTKNKSDDDNKNNKKKKAGKRDEDVIEDVENYDPSVLFDTTKKKTGEGKGNKKNKNQTEDKVEDLEVNEEQQRSKAKNSKNYDDDKKKKKKKKNKTGAREPYDEDADEKEGSDEDDVGDLRGDASGRRGVEKSTSKSKDTTKDRKKNGRSRSVYDDDEEDDDDEDDGPQQRRNGKKGRAVKAAAAAKAKKQRDDDDNDDDEDDDDQEVVEGGCRCAVM